jgi:ketosteroid isomerase-like protein
MTPDETMAAVIVLRQAGSYDEAAESYAEDAVMMVQPGTIVTGRSAVRDGFAAMGQMFPSFTIDARTSIINGDLALHHSSWTAQGSGPDGEPQTFKGKTADVLKLQSDGRWFVVIDNPWGTALLD